MIFKAFLYKLYLITKSLPVDTFFRHTVQGEVQVEYGSLVVWRGKKACEDFTLFKGVYMATKIHYLPT